jgi:hypothetical protein
MRQLTTILGLMVLATMSSCKKEDPTTEDANWCGTEEPTWFQTVTKNDLVGNWLIRNINYSKSIGNTKLYDTSYSVAAPLVLNANGTGTIYSKPLNWSLTASSKYLPKLTITQLDTLFPFPVGFIHNDSADIYMRLAPSPSFYGSVCKTGTTLECSDISFGRL